MSAECLNESKPRNVILLAIAALCLSMLALVLGTAGAHAALAQADAQHEGYNPEVENPKSPGSPDCGTDWNRVSSPNADSFDNQLFGIAVISSYDIWAVGWDYPLDGDAATLTEHWDGNSWTIVDSPSPHHAALLYSVSAISTNNVWAVGFTFDVNYNNRALMG